MDRPDFVYVTYIATTPEKLWNALTDPEVTAQYWQHVNVSDWKPGSKWEHRRDGVKGEVLVTGRIIESVPHRRLVWTWVDPKEITVEERHELVTFEIEPYNKTVVRLTVTHDRLTPGSLKETSEGWPQVLSSLKSLLESGKPLPRLWAS